MLSVNRKLIKSAYLVLNLKYNFYWLNTDLLIFSIFTDSLSEKLTSVKLASVLRSKDLRHQLTLKSMKNWAFSIIVSIAKIHFTSTFHRKLSDFNIFHCLLLFRQL
ncbi:hypothetical protein T07_9585 [Trichinella nelsoni]|uniref:Uncharacterized protein n=1 Tax=Trichinella nelsoni TaxID=6336 RepID=A0A0V0S4I0_9BILA|nr:hypothetical protein T07_9585 [Trichinella nelsoni]